MAVAFRAGAGNSGNTAAPSIVVPAGCQSGDVVLVQITQNNTDAQTAAPASLTQLDLNTAAASYPNRFLYGVVGQNGLTAGGTLSWTLSATRQWSVALYAVSGVDNTTPIQGTLQVAATVATQSTMTAPSITTTGNAWLVECATGKGNGTTITSWTVSSGWTTRATAAGAGTFGGSAVFADRDAGTAAAGTYGGDTYTPSAASGASVRYIIALNPASTGSVSGSATTLAATAAATSSGATGTSASATQTATTTATSSGVVGKSSAATALASIVSLSASGQVSGSNSASSAVTVTITASGSVAAPAAYVGTATLSLTVTTTADGVASVPAPVVNTRPYMYVPPTWRNVAPLANGGVLRVSFETSTCVYRRDGVWTNVMVAGQDDVVDLDVWVNPDDPSDTLLLFFTRPTPVPSDIAMELESVDKADSSWTDAQLISLDGSGSTPTPPVVQPTGLTWVDNGDGTFTVSGPGVVDNGDGTFTFPANDNGDGTWSSA